MSHDTVADSLVLAARELARHSDSPRLDAEVLLCKILGLSRTGLIVHGDDRLDSGTRCSYEDLIGRRARGIPIAYLTGTREFWSLALRVTPDVLVPRPETESLVQRALELLPVDQDRKVLDLGTGSGAIALALATERPRLFLTGTDVCAAALAIARENARTLGLSRIQWRLGSWFEAVPHERFDMIVSNPPYVADTDPAMTQLAAEPPLALTPGPTGLEALDAIVRRAAPHLNPRGWLLLEHGSTQSAEVAELLDQHGFSGVRSHLDEAGKPRITLATLLASH